MIRYASKEAWEAEARRLFGDDWMEWKFVCPSCGHVAAVKDWKAVGASAAQVAFSCVGRYMAKAAEMCEKPGPCNYAGGGLIRLNPVQIEGHKDTYFDFARTEPAA